MSSNDTNSSDEITSFQNFDPGSFVVKAIENLFVPVAIFNNKANVLTKSPKTKLIEV